jgi:hypothetical protein
VVAGFFSLQRGYSFDGLSGAHLIGLTMCFTVCLAAALQISATP